MRFALCLMAVMVMGAGPATTQPIRDGVILGDRWRPLSTIDRMQWITAGMTQAEVVELIGKPNSAKSGALSWTFDNAQATAVFSGDKLVTFTASVQLAVERPAPANVAADGAGAVRRARPEMVQKAIADEKVIPGMTIEEANTALGATGKESELNGFVTYTWPVYEGTYIGGVAARQVVGEIRVIMRGGLVYRVTNSKKR